MAFAAIFGVAALALGMQVAGVEGQLVFVVAGVGVAGLAWALGEATEQAGGTAGPRVSALLNASFGNLPELVILVLAINAGLADIARASIIGSVIGNVLLILGLALLLGGWRHGIQRFNERMAGTNASMLILGVVGLGLPTLFHAVDPDMQAELTLSRFTAAALLLCYVAYVYFSFTTPGLQYHDEPGELAWTRTQAVAMLVATAVATGVVSEVLVHSIEPTIKAWGVPREFIGLIVVPFVGNVAEHFSAVKLAINNRMDFAMGIAFGSGIQISLLASAVAVFASMLIGKELSLVFDPLQLAALGAAAIGVDDGGAVGRDQLAGGAAAAGHLLHRGGGVLAAVTGGAGLTFNRRYWSIALSLWLAACLVLAVAAAVSAPTWTDVVAFAFGWGLFAVVLWWTLATVRTQRAGERVRSIERALDEQLASGEISAEQHERLLRTLHGK